MTTQLKHKVPTDYSQTVFYKIHQLSIYIQFLGKKIFEIRKVNITPDEFAAMNFIINNPRICQRDLAKLMLRDRVRTGRIISTLEEKGYVERVNDTKNNRLVRRLSITTSGKKLYNEQFSILSQVFENILEKFSEEKMVELTENLNELKSALAEVIEFNI